MCIRFAVQLVSIPGLALSLLAGCDDPSGPDHSIPGVWMWVAGEAAEALDDRGRFILPVPEAPGERPIINPLTAQELAGAFVRTFAFPDVVIGTSFGEEIVDEHGSFDPEDVRVAEPIYYGDTPYGTVPSDVPISVVKYLGPVYVSYYELDGRVVANLAGSAYNFDLWIEEGELRMPPVGGNAFRTSVIPRGQSVVLPLSPEAAVEHVGRLTGAHTTKVPRLMLPHRHYSAQWARWELVVDRPLKLTGYSTGDVYTTDHIYVGFSVTGSGASAVRDFKQLWVPLPEQPMADTILYPAPGSDPEVETLEVNLVGPVRFEAVQPRR